MKVVMDADCLIKLTKAGLKERICSAMSVAIPGTVKRETVDRAAGLPDADCIRDNIGAGLIRVVDDAGHGRKGEERVLELFRLGGFDAVATDDRRFLRHLKILGVPFAVPAVLIVALQRQGTLGPAEATAALDSIRPYVSEEQYSVALLAMEQKERT